MKAALLVIATIRRGIIVFIKKEENTRIEAIQAATMIHISHPDGRGEDVRPIVTRSCARGARATRRG